MISAPGAPPQILGHAHLDVELDGEARAGDGLHTLEQIHELLSTHVWDVEGADGLLDPARALGFLLIHLLPLDLLHVSLLRHASRQ